MRAQVTAVGVVREQRAQHARRGLEIIHPLEQRRDPQPPARRAGRRIVQPRLPRQQQRREHIGRRRRHRDHAGLHRLRAEPIDNPPRRLKAPQRLVRRQPRAGREPVAIQLPREQCLALLGRQIEVAAALGRNVELVDHPRRRFVKLARVIAQIQRGEVKAERARPVQQRLHRHLRAG